MTSTENRQNIVLCVAAPKPQVVERALRILTQERDAHIAEIRFIANEDSATPDDQRKKLLSVCSDYGIEPCRIRFDWQGDSCKEQGSIFICPSRNEVRVGEQAVKLTPREFFFYVMYALFRVQGRNGDGTVSLNELTVEDFNTPLRYITRGCGKELSIEECHRSKQFKFLSEMVEQVMSASRKRDLDIRDFKEKLCIAFTRTRRKIREAGLPTGYAIRLRKERGEACYCLPLPLDRIQFEEQADDFVGNIAGRSNPSLAA